MPKCTTGVYIFLYTWGLVNKQYRIRKWFWSSTLAIIVLSFIYSLNYNIFSIPIFKTQYALKNQWKYEYIEAEINRAANKYGITYSEKTITTLKKGHNKMTISQIKDINKAFKNNILVSLDTIIMAKIMVHNKKNSYNYCNSSWYSFPYPHPKSIFKQLLLSPKDSNEYKELVNLVELESEFILTEMDDYYRAPYMNSKFDIIKRSIYYTSDSLNLKGKNINIILKDSLLYY